MGTTHLTFRFSDEALAVLQKHQADLSCHFGRKVDRTQALEDIIIKFDSKPVGRLKKLFSHSPSFEKGDRPLELFLNAEKEAVVPTQ